jgi:hypothetical protein
MFLEVLAFGGLQIEPSVGEGLYIGQKGFDEWMEFIL